MFREDAKQNISIKINTSYCCIFGVDDVVVVNNDIVVVFLIVVLNSFNT